MILASRGTPPCPPSLRIRSAPHSAAVVVTPATSPIAVLRDAGAAAARLTAIAERTGGSQMQAAVQAVDAIIEQVHQRGDEALLDLTERFDGIRPEPLRIPAARLAAAWESTSSELRQALELAHERILAFHQRQMPEDLRLSGPHGELLGRRWRPVERAGLYVPGGRAAHLAGVEEIYRVGGAQAIAALAYGTASIPRVDVISGPGNLYVTLAKKAVYGRVSIDSLAGPSEVLVIADHSARADQVAADLLAQAEHDPLAAAILLTTSAELAAAMPSALEQQLTHHPRAEITRSALRDWGLIVLCDTLEQAAGLSDCFAPEHLELLVEDPEALAQRIQHAGAIFLGPYTPEAVGDYLAGPNHTLPTSGTARFAGALSVETFLRHTSLIRFNREALAATGPAVITLAESEGLHSHAESVRRRLG
jgi:histidinol dehydrogenase